MITYGDYMHSEELTNLMFEFLTSNNFEAVTSNGMIHFKNNLKQYYLKFSYVKKINIFVIETCNDLEKEAKNFMYEDSDSYDGSIPLNKLVEIIKEDILMYYM